MMKKRRIGLALGVLTLSVLAACEEPTTAPEVGPEFSMNEAEYGAFTEVEMEPFGRFGRLNYMRITGRFEGTTEQGAFRVPFELVVPKRRKQGNGIVLIEPPHFAQRFSGRDDYLGQQFLFGRGYRWASVGWSGFGQSILDPTATDVFIAGGQDDGIVLAFVEALKKDPDAKALLGPAERFYGYGFSQTSWLVHRMLRSDAGPGLFDFTMLNATWWQGGGFQGDYTPVSGVGKVVIVQAEADLIISDGRLIRAAADVSSEYRVYEVAGASHIPDIPENHDNPIFGPGIPGTNPVDWSVVARAGFVAGDKWARRGNAPPPSVFLQDDPSGDADPVYGIPTGIARDEDLNAVGGVRLPEVELGFGRYMAGDPNATVAFLTGAFEDISCTPRADGSTRFPTHRSYVKGVSEVARGLRKDGLILRRDAFEIRRAAARSDTGKPGSCPS